MLEQNKLECLSQTILFSLVYFLEIKPKPVPVEKLLSVALWRGSWPNPQILD
jgi:hypothetical protein